MQTLTRRTQRLQELTATVGAMMWQGHRQSMVAAEHVGLTLPQHNALLALAAQGGRSTMSDLVRLTHQSPATLTGIMDRLIGAGLVERTRDTADRRVVYVGLTAAGQARLDEANQQREADVARIAAHFSDADLLEFDHLLGMFVAGLAAMVKARPDADGATQVAHE